MLDFAKNDKKRPDRTERAADRAEADAMRRESEARLRIKKLQLKRFHDQICLRIAEKECQNRLQAQQRAKLLVWVVRLDAALNWTLTDRGDQAKSTAAFRKPRASVTCRNRSTGEEKRTKGTTCFCSFWTKSSHLLKEHEVLLQPCASRNQRVALHATARRRYMEREREDVHRHSSKSKRPQSLKTGKDGLDRNRSGGTTKTDSKRAGDKSQESRRESNLGVKTYVAKSSAVTDVHTNTFALSTSLLAAKYVFTSKWQRRPHPGGEPIAALSKPDAHAHSMPTTYNVIDLYQEEEKSRCSAVVIVAVRIDSESGQTNACAISERLTEWTPDAGTLFLCSKHGVVPLLRASMCQQLRAVQAPKEAGATAHERLQAAARHKRPQERLITCMLKQVNLTGQSSRDLILH
ncbi:hypothetical protein FI667_g6365, partial [Globisporangium splendens]